MIIVTTGNKYTDIDGFASVIAYSKLQTLKNIESLPVLVGDLNQSVTEAVKKLKFEYQKDFKSTDVKYVLMDISNPEFLPDFINLDRVIKVYDHHFGYEEFWRKKIGDDSKIEEIGATATFIFEDIVKEGKLDEIEDNLLLLLYTAIISNTLNLNANVTKNRDREAIKRIKGINIVPQDWDEKYFNEVSSSIINNPLESMGKDTKVVNINNNTFNITQLELWNSKVFIEKNKSLIENVLKKYNGYRFLTTPSISENKTYFITNDDQTKKILIKIFGFEFDNNIAILNQLILRKEIVRKLHTFF